jgi:hypothetical protein
MNEKCRNDRMTYSPLTDENILIEVLVFSTPTKYRVVKITRSNSEIVLRITKHTMFYPGPYYLKGIALCPMV